jgi:hypothetical protein
MSEIMVNAKRYRSDGMPFPGWQTAFVLGWSDKRGKYRVDFGSAYGEQWLSPSAIEPGSLRAAASAPSLD